MATFHLSRLSYRRSSYSTGSGHDDVRDDLNVRSPVSPPKTAGPQSPQKLTSESMEKPDSVKWDFHTEFIGACRRRALLADLMHELIHATAQRSCAAGRSANASETSNTRLKNIIAELGSAILRTWLGIEAGFRSAIHRQLAKGAEAGHPCDLRRQQLCRAGRRLSLESSLLEGSEDE